jgi:hypothetical protein
MGDRRKPSEKLGATVTRQPEIIDWPTVFARQQMAMENSSLSGTCPIEAIKEASFFNYSYGLNPSMPVSQAVNPEKIVYYPPSLPKEWDMSLIRFQTPQVPGDMGDLVGGPFF